MQILSYGEDAYTMWALKNKITYILHELEDRSSLEECKAIFRPSFGRHGGEKSSQFGEFDFILLSGTRIYLGESKWDRSSEVRGNILTLKEEQIKRHRILKAYIEAWFQGDFQNWGEFLAHTGEELKLPNGGRINTAPAGSRLAENLFSILETIKDHFEGNKPEVKNLLLYLYQEVPQHALPSMKDNTFCIVGLDYSKALLENSHYLDISK